MRRPNLFRGAFLAILFLLGEAFAATVFEPEVVKTFAGRDVLLLVGPPETTRAQRAHYLDLLKRAGADAASFPVYQTHRLPNEVAGKLGLGKRGANYATMVHWGDPARFGPARVLAPGVVTALSTDADMFVLVESALLAAGKKSLLEQMPEDMAALRPRPQLVIEHVDFEANGKPVYLVDTKVRIKNEGKVAAKGVNVLFQIENSSDGSWYELGRHSGLEVKSGNTITRDLVRTTHDTPLLNDKKEIQPTKYRILVEFDGGSLESTGQFTPMLIKDQD